MENTRHALRRHLEDNGARLADLARAAGVTPGLLTHYCKGDRTPTDGTADRLTAALVTLGCPAPGMDVRRLLPVREVGP